MISPIPRALVTMDSSASFALDVVFDHMWDGVCKDFSNITDYHNEKCENIWDGEYETCCNINILWKTFCLSLENFITLVHPMRGNPSFDGSKYIESLTKMALKIDTWKRVNRYSAHSTHQMYANGRAILDKNIVFISWVMSSSSGEGWIFSPVFPFQKDELDY